MLKNCKSKWNSRKDSNELQEGRKKEKMKMNRGTNRKQKIKWQT